MYKTEANSNTRVRTNPNVQTQRTTNPIYKEIPDISKIQAKQELHQRIINGVMFWSLGALAVGLFYRALMSLVL